MSDENYKNRQIFNLGWSMLGWDSYRVVFAEGIWSHQKLDRLYGVKSFLKAKESVSSCSFCMYPCKASYKIRDGEFSGEGTETGHFTCIGVLGQRLGLTDYRHAIKLMDILNRSGICFYAFSAMVDYATKLYECGLITTKETHGLKLMRDMRTYSELAKMINEKRGFGSVLADGWDGILEETGIDPQEQYIEGRGIVRGSDCIFDARFKGFDPSTITEVVCPRGGQQPWGYFATSKRLVPVEAIREDCERAHFPRESIERIFSPFNQFKFNPGRLTKHVEDVNAVYNSLGICALYQIAGFMNLEVLAELYSAATGIDTKPDELKKRGEAAFNLNKVINVRAGFDRKQDVFPECWFTAKETPNGPVELKDYYGNAKIDRGTAYKVLDEYYDERGWDIETGRPTKKKLEELDLINFL
jgi:aldehyde:ferredoxin oxidoreductase